MEPGITMLKNLSREKLKYGGGTKKPSQVITTVINVKKGIDFRSNDRRLNYILFPYRENGNKGRNDITFTLQIIAPKEIFKKEVIPALTAWINFGGIGARTRRGCGSLYCYKTCSSIIKSEIY